MSELPVAYKTGINELALKQPCPSCLVMAGAPCVATRGNPNHQRGDILLSSHMPRRKLARKYNSKDSKRKAVSGRGRSALVFDYLVTTEGRVHSNAHIASHFGISIDQANNALAHLAVKGLATREGSGLYRASDRALGRGHTPATDTQVQDELLSTPVVIVDDDKVVETNVPDTTSVELYTNLTQVSSEDLDTIIDILLPGGVSGKDFSRVAKWREETLEMISDLQS